MENEGIPASIVLVVIGLVIGGIGWMFSLNIGSEALGNGLVAVGALLFGLGMLIEFFSMGASLRRISRRLEAPSLPDRPDTEAPEPDGPAASA